MSATECLELHAGRWFESTAVHQVMRANASRTNPPTMDGPRAEAFTPGTSDRPESFLAGYRYLLQLTIAHSANAVRCIPPVKSSLRAETPHPLPEAWF